MKQSNLQRINRIMDYYYKMGTNKESVNAIYLKIISLKSKN
jgi:hypothetical protein